MEPAWGSVADWVTALATLLALAAAVWAGRAAHGQLLVLQADADARSKEAEERQARAIFMLQRQTVDLHSDEWRTILVHNRSEAPIRDVEVAFIGPNNQNSIHIGTVEPTPEPLEVPVASRLANDALQQLKDEAPPGLAKHLGQLVEFGLAVTFTDTAGRRWQRLPDHSLVPREPTFSGWEGSEAAAQAFWASRQG